MLHRYKPSMYNVVVKGDGERDIVYNTYSGAMAFFDKPIDRKIAGESDIDQMYAQGFIVPYALDEQNRYLLERSGYMFSKGKHSLRYVVATTLDCQASCVYCFQKYAAVKSTMSLETARAAVEFIKADAVRTKTPAVNLTMFGGEPLLNQEALFFIADAIQEFCADKQIKFHTDLITNGILLTKGTAEALRARANLRFAQITLDGMHRQYFKAKGIDAFQTVVDNIREVCDFLPVHIRLNLTKDNQSNVDQLLDYLLRECGLDGWVRIAIAPVIDYFGSEGGQGNCLTMKEFTRYLNKVYRENDYRSLHVNARMPKPHRTYCGMENCMNCVIGPDGELYKCDQALGNPNKIIGSVQDGRFANEEEMLFYYEVAEACLNKRCPILPACAGGCRIQQLSGNPVNCAVELEKMLSSLRLVAQDMVANR